MPNLDESLAGTEPTTQQAAEPSAQEFAGGTPFGNPNGAPLLPPPTPVKYLSLDEVLSSAKRKVTYAHICLRADLEGQYEELMLEIAGMVDTQGKPLQSAQQDAGLNEVDAAAVVQGKYDASLELRRHMNAATRTVEFEGMAEDEWTPWDKQHRPKGQDPDLRDYHDQLIAKVAVNPTLTVEGVKQLRSKLGAKSINELENQAYLANVTGGVDLPKSPAFLRNLSLR